MLKSIIERLSLNVLVLACILIAGTMTYAAMPRESSPDIDIPVVMVTTPYIGVAPRDIEKLITVPLENELSTVADVKKMSSTSAEGVSLITLEFQPDVIIEEALQRVRDRVDRARAEIPDDAEETDIREMSFSDVPIMIVTIGGPLDPEDLKRLGDDLAEEIERVPGVLEAPVAGGREREFRILVDPFRLSHYGLALHDITGAIAAENVNIPGGDVTTGDARFLLRVPGDVTTGAELARLAVKRVGDLPVLVRDIARVEDGLADAQTYARLNGQPAVSVAVKKRTGANILEIAEAVRAIAGRHQSARWPEGTTFRVLGDQSTMVNDMVSELENGILTALILVVGVLLFAMGARNSLFVAAAIPLSMLLAILVLSSLDFTLNMMVLFSLILALGMLVDNGIVIIENIYRHAEMGKPLFEAAYVGTKEVGGAVAASTATTVGAFLPLVFWTGIMGQFMGFLPKTVITVLIASLVVALIFLPVFASRLMRVVPKKEASPPALHPVLVAYQQTLRWATRHGWITVGIGAVSFVASLLIFGAWGKGVEFFPETDPNRATIVVRAPDGTDLDATDRIVREIEAIIRQEENVDVYVAEVGVSGGADPMQGSQASANHAKITVDFLKDRNTAKDGESVRVEPTPRTIDRLRARVAQLAGAEITVEKERMGPPVGAPIAVEVSGEDFHAVGAFAETVIRELGAIEGTTDLRHNYRVGRPELRLRIDRAAAKRVGADTRTVGSTIRTAFAGTKASTIRDGDDEYDIVVRLAPEFRQSLSAALSTRVPGRLDTSPDTFPVPLSSVAQYQLVGGSGSIRHIDQDMVVTISGNVTEGTNENLVRAKVAAYIEKKEAPAGMHLRLGGANDEQRDAQDFLGKAFLIAIFLILFVLVYQFNSFAIPFVILTSVILSLIGVFLGLWVAQMPFGIIMTGIGVISLAGVVVNNAIVLLDYIEQLRARGLDLEPALLEAGLTRFRPVVLTAITTILGLIPMAVGVSFDFRAFRWIIGSQSAQWWSPMAVAVIFGLAVATALTLVMVPALYAALDPLRQWTRKSTAELGPSQPTETAAS